MKTLAEIAKDAVIAANLPNVNNVAVDIVPEINFTDPIIVGIREETSAGKGVQIGHGPMKTPVVIEVYGKNRTAVIEAASKISDIVLAAFTSRIRKGFGIHGAYRDDSRCKIEKYATAEKIPTNRTCAARYIIVTNTINR